MCLLFTSTVIYAQISEELSDYKSNAIERAQKVKEYGITRKEHPDNPCERRLDEHGYEISWYDSSQTYINSRLCEPALWFDNFFASDRIFDEGVAGTYIRWRNDFTYDEEDYFSYRARLKLSVTLPGLKNKVRLSFEGKEDEDLRDIAPGNGNATSDSLSLQFDLKEDARSKFNVSVSFSPRVRFRYRYKYPVYQDITLRLTQELQWENDINSARTRFDFEQEFTENILFRTTSEVKISENFDGIDWLQAVVLYQWLNKKLSLAYEASISGITEPYLRITDYRLGLRLRKNFHREWLFYEVSPEITWPVTLDEQRITVIDDRRSKWAIFFRFEVHFGNMYKKQYGDFNRF